MQRQLAALDVACCRENSITIPSCGERITSHSYSNLLATFLTRGTCSSHTCLPFLQRGDWHIFQRITHTSHSLAIVARTADLKSSVFCPTTLKPAIEWQEIHGVVEGTSNGCHNMLRAKGWTTQDAAKRRTLKRCCSILTESGGELQTAAQWAKGQIANYCTSHRSCCRRRKCSSLAQEALPEPSWTE